MATKKKPTNVGPADARKARAESRMRADRANRLAEANKRDNKRPAARVEDRLAAMGGASPTISPELLEVRASVAEQILDEDAEHAAAASRRALMNSLPAMTAIVKAASRAQAEAEDAARLNEPAAFRADLYSTAKRASAKNSRDAGIRALVAYLEKRWTTDPNGCVTRGELRKVHAHFERLYPRSDAAQVLRSAGANSFSRVNLQELGISAHRVASIQDPNERRREFAAELNRAGIRTNSPEGIRAAAYLEARIAQIMSDAVVDAPMDAPMAPAMDGPDADLGVPPHAESEETYSEVSSPVTGEPLVIELAPGADAGEDAMVADEPQSDFGALEAFRLNAGMEPGQAAEELELYLTTTGALYPKIQGVIRNLLQRMRSGRYDETRAPSMWRYVVDEAARMYAAEFALGNARDVFSTSVRDRVAQELAQKYAEQMTAGEYDYLLRAAQIDGPSDMPSDTGGFSPAPDMEPSMPADNGVVLEETSTVIEDPTAPGELLKVDVTPATGEEYETSATDGDIDGPGADFAVFEDGADAPFDMISASSMREALGYVYQRSGGDQGGLRGARVLAQVSTFDRVASIDNKLWVVRADVLAAEARRDQDLAARRQQVAASEAAAQADGGAPPVAEAAPTRTLSAADAGRIATALGFDEKRIAADITRGTSVSFGPWSIGLGDDGQVALQKAGSRAAPRAYPFSRKSLAIREFMARVAGTADLRTAGSFELTPVYRVTCAACKVENDYPLAKAAAVACGSCKRAVSQIIVQAAMESADSKQTKRAGGRDYLLSVGFPVFASADAQALALNADRARSLVAEVVPSTDVVDARPSAFKLLLRGASQAALNRVQALLADRLGVVAQYAPAAVPSAAPAPGMAGRPMPPPGNAMAPSNVPPAPVTAPMGPAAPGGALQPTPTTQPGGAPMAPKPAAGSDAQAKAIEKVKDMGKISSAGSAGTIIKMADLASALLIPITDLAPRTAQLEGLGDLPEMDAAPILEEGAALTPPAEAGGLDALLGPGGEGGAMSVSTSVIDPEGEDAARSAMTHYRNQGMGIAQAIKEFLTEYKGFLEDFGDSSSPPRQMAEAALVRIAKEVYEKPVVLQPTASRKAAEANPNNAGAVMGPDSGPAEPKALEPKVVPSFGTNVPTGSMSAGNTEGDIPSPREKPGHPVGPKVPSLGDPEKVFKETLPVSGGDVTLKGASAPRGRGWGAVLAEGAE